MDWDNEEVDRCSIFNCYNSLWAQWHKTNLSRKAPSIMRIMTSSLVVLLV